VFQGEIGDEGRTFRFAKNRVGSQFICEATDLSRIANEKHDFVISSHTIEHISNPLKALLEWKRVLKRKGILLLACPNKEYTFDHDRAITRIGHLFEDYEKNIDEGDLTHIPEALQFTDFSMYPGVRNLQDFVVRSRDNIKNRALHHNVFDTRLVVQMVSAAGFKVLFVGTHRFHIIVLCQKSNGSFCIQERLQMSDIS
jgi:ubiquinone/menaquinone biosynthesis C-methylase UbiE